MRCNGHRVGAPLLDASSMAGLAVRSRANGSGLDVHAPRRSSSRRREIRRISPMVRGHQPLPSGLREGDIVAGKYRIAEVIGAGAMGTVVAARHVLLEEKVAIKFLDRKSTRLNSSHLG